MNRHLLIIAFLFSLFLPETLLAQKDDSNRQQWIQEMRQYKRTYLTKELGLNQSQQNRFLPLYEEMEEQTFRISDEARQMEKRISEMENPSDTELEKATEAQNEARLRVAEIERDYMEKFKGILTSRQLFELNSVERNFQKDMLKQHHRLRQNSMKATPKSGIASPKARRVNRNQN